MQTEIVENSVFDEYSFKWYLYIVPSLVTPLTFAFEEYADALVMKPRGSCKAL